MRSTSVALSGRGGDGMEIISRVVRFHNFSAFQENRKAFPERITLRCLTLLPNSIEIIAVFWRQNKISVRPLSGRMAFPETWRFFALFSSPAAIVSTIATSIEQQSAADPRIASDVAQASEGITEVNRNVAQSNISVKAISH